ncbi:MAG: thymidylate synthase [Candidatus Pacearchaeota archaeon]
MNENDRKRDGRIPSFYIEARTIPEAYWKALHDVHFKGYPLRTQYDRKDSDGSFIDPPGRDAKVMIKIDEPFGQPRFPALSFCERGKYVAEFLGTKDHMVVPYAELIEKVRAGGEFEPTQWPYCYHQRLAAYPKANGEVINQLEIMLDKLAKDSITRRAIATTRLPEIDLFMAADMPCLGEIQLRAIEDENSKKLVLNMHANWRSRDLLKAWGDNLIGITSLQARLAARLAEKTGREVIVGPYTEMSSSLHIYGQDYVTKGRGWQGFFDRFPDVESFVKRARTSEQIKEFMIAELEEFKKEPTWKFPPEAIKLIENLIDDYKSGKFIP